MLERVEREPNVRVVILTGAGKAFSSGFDLELREGDPEFRFGNGPPLLITPFSVGLAKPKELLLTDEMLSAQEAERLGMINRVVPHDRLMGKCEKTARKLIKVANVGVKYNKEAINRAFENMGFLNTIYHNLELVTLFDTTPTEEQVTFNRIR